MADGPAGKVLDKLFSPPGVHVLIGLRAAAAAMLMAPGNSRAKTTASAYLSVSNVLLSARNSYGADGSDHVNVLVCTALTLSKLFRDDEKVRKACTAFIAGQSVISYLAAGTAKVISADWRNGRAMRGIFRTRTFGQRHVSVVQGRQPGVTRQLVDGAVSVVAEPHHAGASDGDTVQREGAGHRATGRKR